MKYAMNTIRPMFSMLGMLVRNVRRMIRRPLADFTMRRTRMPRNSRSSRPMVGSIGRPEPPPSESLPLHWIA